MHGDRLCFSWSVFGVVSLALAGCGPATVKTNFVPPSDVAQAALEGALDAWKSGQLRATAKGSTQTVELADSTKQQRKLESYQIVGAAPPVADDPNPRFTVKLKFEGANDEVEQTYIVVGKQPIWVFSQADYRQIGGM